MGGTHLRLQVHCLHIGDLSNTESEGSKYCRSGLSRRGLVVGCYRHTTAPRLKYNGFTELAQIQFYLLM